MTSTTDMDIINMIIKRWDCTVSRRLNFSLTHLVSFAIIPTGDATGNGAQPIILREILAEFQVSRLSSRPQLMGLLAQRGRFPFGLPNSRLGGEICKGTPFLDCNMATKISTDFNKDMSEILPLWFFSARDVGCGAETSTAISQARGISCRVHGSRW